MYFESRKQAGRELAKVLVEKYRYENAAVVALSVSSVPVGAAIAEELHCPITLVISKEIEVPGENLVLGTVSDQGDFAYNSELSDGEIAGYTSEYHGYIAEQKRIAFNQINRLVGDGGTIDPALLRDRVVILVADGFLNSALLGAALEYLKPIRIVKLVVAAPIASVSAVDQLHVAADEIHILDVREELFEINHYFETDDKPTEEQAIADINRAILNWR